MSATTKLVGFLVALLAVFGGAVGIGRLLGAGGASDRGDAHREMDVGQGDEGGSAKLPKGLMVSQDGYTFRLAKTTPRCPARTCRWRSRSRVQRVGR